MLVIAAVSVPSMLTGLPAHRPSRAATRMGLFDGLAAAFENDDSLGEAGPAGLKTKVQLQKVTWIGPKPEGAAAFFEKQVIVEQEAMPGTALKDLAEQAGVKIRYSCNKGTCGICDVVVDGATIPACTAKLAKGRDISIEYQDESKMLEYSKQKIKAERLAKKTGKAAPAFNPLSDVTADKSSAPAASFGLVVPSNPFGGGLFGKQADVEEDENEEEDRPRLTQESLEARIRAEMNAAQAEQSKTKAKSPWPFG